MLRIFETIGVCILGWMRILKDFLKLSSQAFYWTLFGPFKNKPIKRPAVFDQMVFMGIKSIVIVFFVTLFTGIVFGDAVGAPAFENGRHDLCGQSL